MQVKYDDEVPEDLKKKFDKELGFSENPVPFQFKKMMNALNHPKVKKVEVFGLSKGMKVDVNGRTYRVVDVRARDGRLILKPTNKESADAEDKEPPCE